VRKASDNHILRIARDRCGAANVGGHRDRKQVGNWVALEPPNDLEDERRHDEADRVIDKEGRERSGHQHDRCQEYQRVTGARHDPTAY